MRRRLSYLPESATAHLLDNAARRHGEVIGDEPFGAPLGKVFTVLGNPSPVDLKNFMVNDFKPVSWKSTEPDPVLPITSNGTYYLCCTKGTELSIDSASGHIYGIGVDTDIVGDVSKVISEDAVVHIDAQPDGADITLNKGTVLYITKVGATAAVPHTIKSVGCGTYKDKDNKNADDVPLQTWTAAWRVAYNALPPDGNGAVPPNILEIDNEEDGVNTIELTGSGEKRIAACRTTVTTEDNRDLYGIPASLHPQPPNYARPLVSNYDVINTVGRDGFSIDNANREVVAGGVFTTQHSHIPTPNVVTEDITVASFGYGQNGNVALAFIRMTTREYAASNNVKSGTLCIAYGYGRTPTPTDHDNLIAYVYFVTKTRLVISPPSSYTYWSNGITCVDGSIDSTYIRNLVRGKALSSSQTDVFAVTELNQIRTYKPSINITDTKLSAANTPEGYSTGTVYSLAAIMSRRPRHSSPIPTIPLQDMPAHFDNGEVEYIQKRTTIGLDPVISAAATSLGVFSPSTLMGAASLSAAGLTDATDITGNPATSTPNNASAASGVTYVDSFFYTPLVFTASGKSLTSSQQPNGQSTSEQHNIPLENAPASAGGESLLCVERIYPTTVVIEVFVSGEYHIYAELNRRVAVGTYTYPAEAVIEKTTKNVLNAKTSGISIYPETTHATVSEPAVDKSGTGDVPHPDFTIVPAPPTPADDVQITDDIL